MVGGSRNMIGLESVYFWHLGRVTGKVGTLKHPKGEINGKVGIQSFGSKPQY